MTNTDKAISSIRKSLSEREAGMPEGTIIRFAREKQVGSPAYKDARRTISLNYAALFVNNSWYLTGTVGIGADSYTNKEFMDLLSSKDYTNIAVATEFETI